MTRPSEPLLAFEAGEVMAAAKHYQTWIRGQARAGVLEHLGPKHFDRARAVLRSGLYQTQQAIRELDHVQALLERGRPPDPAPLSTFEVAFRDLEPGDRIRLIGGALEVIASIEIDPDTDQAVLLTEDGTEISGPASTLAEVAPLPPEGGPFP